MEIPTLASLKEPKPAPPAEEEKVQEKVALPEPEEQIPRAESFWPASIEETIKLVMSGRLDRLEHLRSQLYEVPELWQQVSDLTRVAIQGWSKKISKGNVAFQESIVLAAIEEREKLLGEATTIMERSIVDFFIISKLRLEYHNIVESCSDESIDYSRTGIAMNQRQRSAEHLFREATRQLAKIRVIQDEIPPASPAVASIKLYDPDTKQKVVA